MLWLRISRYQKSGRAKRQVDRHADCRPISVLGARSSIVSSAANRPAACHRGNGRAKHRADRRADRRDGPIVRSSAAAESATALISTQDGNTTAAPNTGSTVTSIVALSSTLAPGQVPGQALPLSWTPCLALCRPQAVPSCGISSSSFLDRSPGTRTRVRLRLGHLKRDWKSRGRGRKGPIMRLFELLMIILSCPYPNNETNQCP